MFDSIKSIMNKPYACHFRRQGEAKENHASIPRRSFINVSPSNHAGGLI